MRCLVLVLASFLIQACASYTCFDLRAHYRLALETSYSPDTLAVGGEMRFFYGGDAIKEVISGRNYIELNPGFGVTINVYKIDSSGEYPEFIDAANSFTYEDGITGSFLGHNYSAFNLLVLNKTEKTYAGEVILRPKEPGLYLFEICCTDVVKYYSRSDYRCDKLEQLEGYFKNSNDIHELTYNRLMKSQAFKPQKNRLLWVK